jgi:hypothetical protein
LTFLKAYSAAHLEVFKPLNIQNGFAAAGIYAFNPKRVLKKLNIYISTPTPLQAVYVYQTAHHGLERLIHFSNYKSKYPHSRTS